MSSKRFQDSWIREHHTPFHRKYWYSSKFGEKIDLHSMTWSTVLRSPTSMKYSYPMKAKHHYRSQFSKSGHSDPAILAKTIEPAPIPLGSPNPVWWSEVLPVVLPPQSWIMDHGYLIIPCFAKALGSCGHGCCLPGCPHPGARCQAVDLGKANRPIFVETWKPWGYT